MIGIRSHLSHHFLFSESHSAKGEKAKKKSSSRLKGKGQKDELSQAKRQG
jgi:hypothetical protein